MNVSSIEHNHVSTYKELPRNIYCELVDTLDTHCYEQSLLEIWMYNEDVINQLSTEDILTAVNELDRSPYFGFKYSYSKLLGSIQRNESGHIIRAKAALYNLATIVDCDEHQNEGHENKGHNGDCERGYGGPQLVHDKTNIIWQDGAIKTIIDMANLSSNKGIYGFYPMDVSIIVALFYYDQWYTNTCIFKVWQSTSICLRVSMTSLVTLYSLIYKK